MFLITFCFNTILYQNATWNNNTLCSTLNRIYAHFGVFRAFQPSRICQLILARIEDLASIRIWHYGSEREKKTDEIERRIEIETRVLDIEKKRR